MATLHFTYSTMNAGKSTALLQSNHGYKERGMNTMIFTSSKDDRYGDSEIVSRIGLRADAETFTESDNLFKKPNFSLRTRLLSLDRLSIN